MGLIISISKSEGVKASTLNSQLLHLCEGIVEKEDEYIYIPLFGELIPILKIFVENNISYDLKNDYQDA